MVQPNLTKPDQFLHDISTPLTVVLLNLELLLNSNQLTCVQRSKLLRTFNAALKIKIFINNYRK